MNWDGDAADYAQLMDDLAEGFAPVTEAMLRAAQVGPDVRLLDLACGPGHATEAARRRGARPLGIDLSGAMLDEARRRFPDCRFEEADMLEPPRGPWDAITCRFGGHHVPAAWLTAAFAVLRPGGRLAIAEWAPADPPTDSLHERDADGWRELIGWHGFDEIFVEPVTMALDTHLDRDIFIVAARRPA